MSNESVDAGNKEAALRWERTAAARFTRDVIVVGTSANRPAAFGPARAFMALSSTSVLTRNRCPSSATSYG
jgi:hypothetical protein